MIDLLGRLFGRLDHENGEVAIHAEEVDRLAERGDRERERACRAIGAWNKDEGVIRDVLRDRADVAETLLRARDRGREEAGGD